MKDKLYYVGLFAVLMLVSLEKGYGQETKKGSSNWTRVGGAQR